MGLKDFDNSKIKSWRYSQVGTKQKSQTFVDGHSGTNVDGTRDVISGKFVNDTKTFLIGNDTLLEPNVDDTPLNPLTQQQNYTITNTAGEYTITGLKGAKIPGWELQKGLSLILTNWSDMVDAKTLTSYKVARVGRNATHGHLEIPYSYKNFGSTSVDAEAFSYGSLSPNIGWTVELERGGNAVDGITKDYKKILESGGMWDRFVEKQSDKQVMGTITVGSRGFFEAPFDTFNSLDYLMALGGTAQPYRLGSIMFGVPRYSKHTPVINDANYSDISQWHPTGDSIGADDNFAKESKMLYLYENFILNDPPDPPSGWANIGVAFATSYWASITNPYPIVPSINIVKAPGYGTTHGQTLAWTDKNLMYGGPDGDGHFQRKYATDTEAGSTISEDNGKWDFFSKSGPSAAYLQDSYMNELNMEAGKEEISDNADFFPPNHIFGLRQQMTDNDFADKIIPISVQQSLGGENTLEKFSKDTRGLVNKYSTLGYNRLGLEGNLGSSEVPDYQDITYETTLHSPSEWNAAHDKVGGYASLPGFADVVKKGSGEWKAESGIRKEGQDKVYKIGKQGMSVTTNENQLAPLQPTRVHGFRGQVNKDSHGKLFGDHVDQVNAMPYGDSDPDLDFVPLIFHDVYNKMDIQFRAIFTEDITDTISPSWNPINYIGRTTAVYTYQNTARSIGFGFTIFPKTKQEFPILLEKVNYLVGMCYPNLDDYFRASGPLIKLTAGDIVKQQLGFLSECSVTFPSSESPWETDKGLQFTKKIDLLISVIIFLSQKVYIII
jgi:hypothetical protein